MLTLDVQSPHELDLLGLFSSIVENHSLDRMFDMLHSPRNPFLKIRLLPYNWAAAARRLHPIVLT